MDPPALSSARERFCELDQSLREAIDRRDGELALHLATRQVQELREAADRNPEEAGTWVREALDRLHEQVRRAQAARDALGGEINGLRVRRKLVGAPAGTGESRFGRTFRA